MLAGQWRLPRIDQFNPSPTKLTGAPNCTLSPGFSWIKHNTPATSCPSGILVAITAPPSGANRKIQCVTQTVIQVV